MRQQGARRLDNQVPYFKTTLGKLFWADALEWLPTLESQTIDLAFADPPYNIGKAEWDTFDSQAAYIKWTMTWIREVHRLLKPTGTLYVCGFSEILAHVKCAADPLFEGCKWLVWYYRNKANMRDDWGRSHESLLHFRKSRTFTFNVDAGRVPYNQHTLKYPEHAQGSTSQYGNGKKHSWNPHPLGARPRDVLENPTLCNTTREKTDHPTQKPAELLRRIIGVSSNAGDLVLDPFGGSGTTFAVCEAMGRRWLGSESEREYCDIARARLVRPSVFASDGSRMHHEDLTKRRAQLRFEA